MTERNEHHFPFCATPVPMRGSLGTEVYAIGPDCVAKVDRIVQKTCAPLPNDITGNAYRDLRLRSSVAYIAGQTRREQEALGVLAFVPIIAPLEHHLIIGGVDGYPVPCRVQRAIHGRMLRYTTAHERNARIDTLIALANASVRCRKEHGRHVDLVGTLDGEKPNIVSIVLKLLDPFRHSVNLLLDDSGRLCLVDVKTTQLSATRWKSNLLVRCLEAGFFFLRARALYRKVDVTFRSPVEGHPEGHPSVELRREISTRRVE